MIDNDLPPLWELVQIGDLCEPIETTDPRKKRAGILKYIDISSVDNEQKSITKFSEIESVNAPSRARQLIATNDVLVSTVRPNLNAVALVPATLNGEICSTGFCVLRCKSDFLEPEYLFAWVRHPMFIQSLVQMERGIGYPAVSDGDVKRTRIPLPPLSEQHHIVAIIRQADEPRRLRRAANERASGLLHALFYEMFGDPGINPRKWRFESIDEITDLVTSGSTPKGGSEVYVDEGPYFFRSQNVQMNRLDFSDIACLPQEIHESMGRTHVLIGDVLLNITGASIGRVAWVEQLAREANVSQHVCIVRLDQQKVLAPYVSVCLSLPWGQELINRAQTGASRQGLNHQQVRQIQIPVPPLPLQHEFVKRAITVRTIEHDWEASSEHFETLFKSLLAQVFSGELTAGWREGRAEELAREAEEMKRRLEKKKQPIEIRVEVANPEKLAQTLAGFGAVADVFAQILPPIQIGDVLEPLRQSAFTAFADALRPYTDQLAESLNAGLSQRISSLADVAVKELLANAAAPVVDAWRQVAQPYYADLTAKLAQIAQLTLDQPITRADIEDAVIEAMDELPRYWTLKNLADDWRFNHLSRTVLREAVEMLVVLGKLRQAIIRRETSDPQRPVERLEAFTRITDRDLVAQPADIQL